jgi:flavin-dependent dehydrogenase
MDNPQSAIRNPRLKFTIAGAGPAGSSLAIRLANLGFETTLIERERFPRQKLCGEFISPECFAHFKSLGVLDDMLAAGGERIYETRFFESRGRSVTVPSSWFGHGDSALSLSRAEMDLRLLNRSKEAGVTILDGTSVTGIEHSNGRISSVRTRDDSGNVSDIAGDVFVDATGRARILAKLAGKRQNGAAPASKPEFVGFKAHLRDVDLTDGGCEIYSFHGGYAGLSPIEDGLFNLCFLLKAATVRAAGRDPDQLLRDVVKRNTRAAVTLSDPSNASEWLAVSVEGFGTKKTRAAANLFTVGDAASFIDPFTGSGMVMAMESAAVLADAIALDSGSIEQIAANYDVAYQRKFARRLRMCSLLRRTAFMPNAATAIVSLLAVSSSARRYVARATRGAAPDGS